MGYGLVPMLGGVFELAARALIVLGGRKDELFRCLPCRSGLGGMDFGAALIPLILYYIYVM